MGCFVLSRIMLQLAATFHIENLLPISLSNKLTFWTDLHFFLFACRLPDGRNTKKKRWRVARSEAKMIQLEKRRIVFRGHVNVPYQRV